MAKNVWTDFFHVIQRILQQAAPGQEVSCWSRTWWGSYCGQPEWSSFGGGLHEVQDFAYGFPTFFLVFHIFIFCCKHYVTVRNTNYYLCFLSIRNRVCVFCVFSCRRTTNWREILLRLFVSFCFVLWVCKARLGPKLERWQVWKNSVTIFIFQYLWKFLLSTL